MSEMFFKDNCKVAVFKAPEGDYRKIVIDYMLKMANIAWTPKETFTINWKNEGRYPVNLLFEKGQTYHGVTYSNTKGTLDEFEQYSDDGVFEPNSPYYEEIVGNHCASSIVMAYQQLIDFQFEGSLKPNPKRGVAVKTVGNLKIPANVFGTKWDALDLLAYNSKNDVMEAYALLDAGDTVFFLSKRKSGHIRMVYSKSDVVRFENGEIDPENSFVHCIEQTNSWDKTDAANGKKTTWWVDHKYSFARLYSKEFVPFTLSVFTSGETLKDAYLIYNGNNTPETLKDGLSGTIQSNFPLAYVVAKIKDVTGNVIKKALIYNLPAAYETDLSELNEKIDYPSLPNGKYTLTLRAGIARGGCDFENFTFVK